MHAIKGGKEIIDMILK